MTLDNQKFEAVIFDLDGTLLDTLDDIASACNQALQDFGCTPVDRELYKQLVGYGARNLVTTAVRLSRPDWNSEQIEPIYQVYRQIYAVGWHNQTVIYPGIVDLLRQLRAAGLKLAVLSNKPHDSTEAMIEHYFPKDLFDLSYGQLDPYPTKPDPTLALVIAEKLGVKPSATALAGDSGSDMQTAVNAGMSGLGVLWGFRQAAELLENGAAFLASNATELSQLLLA